MHKNLFKFYIFTIVMFFIFINVFPNIFINVNNSLDYAEVKMQNAYEKARDYKIDIYGDRGDVIIMLDDGWKTQYTVAYKYMHKKGMRGSIAVIPSLIGENEYMNRGDLYKLYDDDWDLLNHTYSHIVLSKNNIDKQIDNINKGEKWLNKNGFIIRKKILIYPEGEYNPNTVTVIKKLNYTSGRSTDDGFNPKIPINPYTIKVKNVFSKVKPKEVESWVDYAIKNRLTLILLFHKLEDDIDKTKMKYKVYDFYKIINYICKKRNNLNIITYSDWIETFTN